MRNPFKRKLRPTDKPTLRERAATLKTSLSRLLTRPEGQGEANQHRRALVAGSVAAAIPLPVLAHSATRAPAAAAETGAPAAFLPAPHPDRALLDLAATLAQAEEVEASAARQSAAAWDAVSAVLRTRPIALVPSRWEWCAVIEHGRPIAPRGNRMHHIPTDPGALPEDHQRWQNAWTGEGLRSAIANAVRLLGKGGRTPHRIAFWKSLLPIADAFDAEVAAVYAATDAKRLSSVAQDARERVQALRREIEELTATTPEGLAVHLRVFLSADHYKGKTDHTALTRSTAAVAGVPLPESGLDPSEWVAAWERLGGSIKRHPRRHGRDELMFVCPDTFKVEPDRLAEIQRLCDEHRASGRVIDRWLYANR
ncbi:hypothetical protein ASG52_24640 [Methylobacterium sp. Leaf456]|uniref:hypothetical protein n=1 Tax=Methylobacterium sp. Leaf456 TaxID=1736382 RepID=UPI0006FD19BE|nr:hypothetical protein [Methylobacterium sp. Leaf456]KQT56109.1 hypothetical protein ASG52_24640 [Methylobacterium sp. Leaf456]